MKNADPTKLDVSDISDFLQYLMHNKEREIFEGNLVLETTEMMQHMDLDKDAAESLLGVFGEFYVFFKFFFKSESVSGKESQNSARNAEKNGQIHDHGEFQIDYHSAAIFNDFCCLFKDKLIPLEKFEKSFGAINKIKDQYPLLFTVEKSVSLSQTGKILGDKLRKYKKLGKKPSKLRIDRYTFKIIS